jgi:hypothetical protein
MAWERLRAVQSEQLRVWGMVAHSAGKTRTVMPVCRSPRPGAVALATAALHPLHKADWPPRVDAGLTRFRHPGTVENEGFARQMTARRTIRAIVPGAVQARPDAALILGGLLLLISP